MPPATPRPTKRANAGATDPVVSAIETKIVQRMQPLLDEHRLPGVAVGIVRDQALVWSAGFGFADVEKGTRPDAHTGFRVASISKTFTALAIVQLRDQGLLALDDPLVKHIREFRRVKVREGHRGSVE